jgi:hypothetical protein
MVRRELPASGVLGDGALIVVSDQVYAELSLSEFDDLRVDPVLILDEPIERVAEFND